MIPLRGTISASSELSPLSYIGGAIQGKSTIRILTSHEGSPYVLRADKALSLHKLQPVKLQAKEGLAIMNGTAISTAAACLVLHNIHGLAVLTQALTALAIKALQGTTKSFHQFFAEVRPHPGQIEASQNILHFLSRSKLVKVNNGTEASLRQDRYSIRTAAQWLGPVLEDLVLAHRQIETECNSATDNPLVGLDGELLHGGNFRAKAVTGALGKARQGLHAIGRMLFSQCTEMINPMTSRDPSSSFIFKGTDLNVAALQSELGFLASPVNNVMTAEMGNQSINSLAFISARYTAIATDVLAQLAACHLLALCQALDIRALQSLFQDTFKSQLSSIFHQQIAMPLVDHDLPSKAVSQLEKDLWQQALLAFDQTVSLGPRDRFAKIADPLRVVLSKANLIKALNNPLRVIDSLVDTLADSWLQSWGVQVDAYQAHGNALSFLGTAFGRLYDLVRNRLDVPFMHSAHLRTPTPESQTGHMPAASTDDESTHGEPVTVGTFTSRVYHAVKSGLVTEVISDLLQQER